MDEACGAVLDEIDARVNLAFVYFSSEYIAEANEAGWTIEQLANELSERLGTDNIIGCCGESIIANQYEFQWQPAISIWVANLPDLQADFCHLQFLSLGDDFAFEGWTDDLAGDWTDNSTVFVFGDPFSFPMDVFLNRMNDDRPGVPMMGGIASGVNQPGDSRLILGKRVFNNGCVLVRLNGSFDIDCVVSQGCRPVGNPMVITKAERNEIHELGGSPAMEKLHEVFRELPTREKQLINQGLQVGRVISEYIDEPRQGDFLIRNVVHIDEESGVIAIADYVRPGQTIQFQIRDQQTAHVDLKQLLTRSVARKDTIHHAAMMFNCNGRGTRLFQSEHHDTLLLREVAGPMPVAGFFAAGEIGPVGGRNFLHGFTSSIAMFQERT